MSDPNSLEMRLLEISPLGWNRLQPAVRPALRKPRRDRQQESSGLPVAFDRKGKTYRVVVQAKQSGRKGYRWEIVSDDTDTIVRQSTTWYGTMAQAYDCGAAALAAFSPAQRH